MTEEQAIFYGRLAELKAFLSVALDRCTALTSEVDRFEQAGKLKRHVSGLCETMEEVIAQASDVQQLLRQSGK